MKQIILAIVLFFLNSSSNAQSSGQKGFIILANGDTTYGWISYKPKQKTPKQIQFRKDSLSKEMIKYTTNEVKYFEIEGGDAFVKAVAGKSFPIATVLTNTSLLGDTVLKEVVFLRVLLRSDKLSLYEWVDDKERYYLQHGDGEVEELLMKKSASGQYETDLALYKDQLKALALEYGRGEELEREINSLGYNEYDLKEFIIKLSGEQRTKIFYSSQRGKMKISFFAGGGAGLSTIKVSGDKKYIGDLYFGNTTIPYLNGGLDLSFPGGFSNTGIRIEASYFSGTYHGEATTPTTSTEKNIYEFQQTNFAAGLSALQYFLNGRQLRFYAGGGVTVNYSSYNKNYLHQTTPDVTINDYVTLNKTWLGASIKTGVILKKKFEIGLTGQILGDMTNNRGVGFDNRVCFLWVGYHF